MKKLSFSVVVLCCFGLLVATLNVASAAEIVAHRQGTVLPAPDYDWWYGCSATSAGMMMGYYDRMGYGGLYYPNLVPGGVAETSTYWSTPGLWQHKAQYAIASPEHVQEFYVNGYGAYGDDVSPPYHSFNCLADFMGTSQDSAGNVNGGTTFWFYTNGARFTAQDAINLGVWSSDGMYGLYEYLVYAGYGSTANLNTDFYNQLIDTLGLSFGFTFADYVAEIDAKRVVLVHVQGHTMLGYGYELGGLMYIYDTWSPGPHTMTWGGSYSGLDHFGVTCFIPSGGVVPIPATMWLLGSGLVGLALWRRWH